MFLIRWLKSLRKKAEPPPCRHQKNWDEERTKEADGTAMVWFHCLDCGMSDRGHVQAGDDWCGKTKCRNGQREEVNG